MQNKGVAPILATVLIVLVVIALAGTFLLWSGRSLTTITERGTQEQQRIAGATGEGVEIVAMACGSTDQITIRNDGSVDITTSQLSVFENETLRTVTWTAATLAPNAVTTSSTFTGWTLEQGDTIRVVTRQGAQDSSRCP